MILVVSPFEEYVIPDALVEAARQKGKGLHALHVRDDIRQAVIDAGFDANTGRFKAVRSRASSKGQKEFDSLVNDVRSHLNVVTLQYLRTRSPKSKERKLSKTEWLTMVRGTLRRGYYTAFELGLKSAGMDKFKVTVSQADVEYLEGAIRHELTYFNRLLREIDKGTYKGKLLDRLAAYSETLKHVFYAGRVMGTPTGMVVDWISPMDRNTCKGCAFLYRHSPYTKKVLPTTPRAGDTPCLNRCRCRLVMRQVSAEEYQRVENGHISKKKYGEWLAAIKAGRVLR